MAREWPGRIGVSVTVWLKGQLIVFLDSGRSATMRLAGTGRSDREGRLEVYHDGRWGTVCNNCFNDVAANVACNSLGFGWGRHSSVFV